MSATWRSDLGRIASHLERGVDAQVKAAAERVARDARARAPRGTSGALARSIGVEQLAGFRGSPRYAVVADRPWRYLEFGTVKMGAQPFVTPAAEGERDRFNAAMRGLVT